MALAAKGKENAKAEVKGGTDGELHEKAPTAAAALNSPGSTAASGLDSDGERSEATPAARRPVLPAAALRRRVSFGSMESSEGAALKALQAAAVAAEELEESDTPCAEDQEPPGAATTTAAAGMLSFGSAAHDAGECQPCPWFWKPTGCQNGTECKRCHLCPEGELKNRKKAKHAMFRLGLATPKTKGNKHVWFPDKATGTCEAEVVEVIPVDAASLTISFSVETQASSAPPASAPPAELEPPGLPQPPPGLPELPPGLQQPQPSRGSELHSVGQCQPCAWFWKPSGCTLGEECLRCHLCPEGELKARKKQKHALLSLGLLTPKGPSKESNTPKASNSTKPAGPAFGDLPAFVTQATAFDRIGLATPKSMRAEAASFSLDSDRGSTTAGDESGGGSGSDTEAAKVATKDQQPQKQQQPKLVALPKGALVSEPPGLDASNEEDAAGPPGAKTADGGVLPVPPGLVPPPETPSHGSVLHNTGNCQPCAWFWKPGSCQNGVNCGYCHLCPESELKARKKAKQTQMRLGLATPKAQKSGGGPLGFSMSADAPEFHMPGGCAFLPDAPAFQPSADAPAFQPDQAWLADLEVHRQAHAIDRIGLATPKAMRVEELSFSLSLADAA